MALELMNIQDCSGCGACINICPQNAVSMAEDDSGYKYPKIDAEVCINCGLCSKACSEKTALNKKNPKCYAVMCDDKIRLKSSSGGVFKCLADWFIENDGYVCGAVFDSDWSVRHIVSDNREDIEKMRGSKYLQSDTGFCFKEIKEILQKNKSVLFSGCPCQIAGLKKYLGRSYSGLYCLDLVCHGVFSYKMFKKYLDENFDTNNIRDFQFRNKFMQGWGIGSPAVNGKIVSNNDFMDLYLKKAGYRESCYRCKYACIPRQGDLTIGDYWNPELNDGMGTSVVLVNNEKGVRLMDILKSRAKKIRQTPLKNAVRSNPNIIKPSVPHKNTAVFRKNFNNITLNENKKIVLYDKADCMIINLWFSLNYGAVLTCFGVKCLCEKLGLNAKVINFTPVKTKEYKGGFSEKFADKYLNLTNPIETFEDLKKLNDNCNTFIAGSDQIWGPFIEGISRYWTLAHSAFMLDFVDNKNKKISYGASLGVADIKSYSLSYLNKMKYYLPQFDFISVRENEGKQLLKDYFNIESEQLIDGAFLIPKEKLYEMTEEYENKDGEYIAYFCLPYYHNEDIFKTKVDLISRKLNLPVKEWKFDRTADVEKWLAFIKNARFVISDSFHCCVFSIIFNVPFVQIINAVNSQSRFESVFRMLGIENNSIPPYISGEELNKTDFNFDWEKINKNIEKAVDKAEKWMINAINSSKKQTMPAGLNDILQDSRAENLELIYLLADRNKIFAKYYWYKIRSSIPFGKKRIKYRLLVIKYKDYVKKIRNLKNIVNIDKD